MDFRQKIPQPPLKKNLHIKIIITCHNDNELMYMYWLDTHTLTHTYQLRKKQLYLAIKTGVDCLGTTTTHALTKRYHTRVEWQGVDTAVDRCGTTEWTT